MKSQMLLSVHGLLLILAETVLGTSEFVCGNGVCKRRGYVACINSGGDFICLQCTIKRAKCATDKQLEGCSLFCQELVRNQTIAEYDRKQKGINASFIGEKQDLERALTKSQNNAQTKVLGVLVACLITALAACLYLLCKPNCQNHKVQNITDTEKGNVNEERSWDDEGRQLGGDPDETSKLVTYDQLPITNSTMSAGCQTDPQDTGTCKKEVTTCTDSDLDGCLALRKLNNIPPTDDNQPVVLEMPDHKHVGIRQSDRTAITQTPVRNPS